MTKEGEAEAVIGATDVVIHVPVHQVVVATEGGEVIVGTIMRGVIKEEIERGIEIETIAETEKKTIETIDLIAERLWIFYIYETNYFPLLNF
jgi:translation elongation factor EF-Tu-like GTPase